MFCIWNFKLGQKITYRHSSYATSHPVFEFGHFLNIPFERVALFQYAMQNVLCMIPQNQNTVFGMVSILKWKKNLKPIYRQKKNSFACSRKFQRFWRIFQRFPKYWRITFNVLESSRNFKTVPEYFRKFQYILNN